MKPINPYGRFEVDLDRRIDFEKGRMSVIMGLPVMTGRMNTPPLVSLFILGGFRINGHSMSRAHPK